MKSLLFVLLPALFLSGCKQSSTPPVGIKDVSAQEAADLIASKSNLVVLDIRTPEEFAAGHIKDARLINFREESFATEIAKLDRATPYLVHCASGNRSGQSLATFRELGFTELYHLENGFKGWQSAGEPVVTE